ncbi:MAG: acetyl-CoA carboxylase carboxyltransferase subunit alpha [Gemmatimonadetes bacterium]|nr:acetyl-CoA carboxylase carboxyltransferase subunit alpha [Gemmatimonadota bacterium]
MTLAGSPRLDFERRLIEAQEQIDELVASAERSGFDVSEELNELKKKLNDLKESTYQNLTPMEQVQVARHPDRPYTLDYIERIFTNWIELHGDRTFRDDEAIVGGWAALGGTSVMVIGHQKGRHIKENLRRNFGMAHPEGYRKALRLMQQAEKFGRAVITFIDTPGAYPGLGSEERGIAQAIAVNLREMARLKVPLVSVIIGEGGSGGALGIGVTDRILIMEHAVYSVISPEGCAAILWHSRDFKEEAAAALKITSKDLLALGVADEIIAEPPGGAHSDWDAAAASVKEALERTVSELGRVKTDRLRKTRWAKYEAMGVWGESAPETPPDAL